MLNNAFEGLVAVNSGNPTTPNLPINPATPNDSQANVKLGDTTVSVKTGDAADCGQYSVRHGRGSEKAW